MISELLLSTQLALVLSQVVPMLRITKYIHTSIQWIRIIIVVVSIQLHSITSYFDCPGYSSSESGSDTCSSSATVITGVVCSLAFLSVGVLLGVVGLHLVQRARGMLSKSPPPSLPPVPQEVTYEMVDVLSSTQKTQFNAKDVYASSENIPTSPNTAYGQVQL